MPYAAYALISVVIFSLVHLWAEKIQKLGLRTQGRFLSAGGGIAIAYIFVDLLPKLSKNDPIVHQSLRVIFPYFERHVYVIALAGFLLFFAVDRASILVPRKGALWLRLVSYALLNFLIGYAVVDKDNPEVRPLVLFTFAMALHYFVNDYTLSVSHPTEYAKKGKWLLIFSLFLGWFSGVWTTLSPAAIAIVSAFIGGGVMMNVMRHELPKENPNSLEAFILAAIFYTGVLLSLG